ncbi:MAG: hypothetical protein ACHQAZ_01490 [Gammaproteobacteria bacterium]
MKNHAIQGFFLLASILSLACQADVPPESTSVPALKAIVPADNDITPDTDAAVGTDPVPNAVAKKINGIVSKDWESTLKEDCGDSPCELKKSSMFGPTFRIKSSVNADLYVFQEKGAEGGWSNYYFIFYDDKTKRITEHPAGIYGKWLDGFYGDSDVSLLKRPFVSFTELNGKATFVAEDYGHNGTLYNAVLYRYFAIGDDLSLKPILAFEEKALWPGDILGLNGTVTRTLQFTGQHTAKISTYFVADSGDKTPRLVGTVAIANSDGAPFHIVGKTVVDKRFEKVLLTLSETDENEFIVGGDSLFY